jgi:hypothetical protein
MTDKFNIQEWAERRVEELATDIKSYIDNGRDYEEAVDMVFESSIVAMPYKMRALEKVGIYRHEHTFVVDVVTGKEWCATCQTFN